MPNPGGLSGSLVTLLPNRNIELDRLADDIKYIPKFSDMSEEKIAVDYIMLNKAEVINDTEYGSIQYRQEY